MAFEQYVIRTSRTPARGTAAVDAAGNVTVNPIDAAAMMIKGNEVAVLVDPGTLRIALRAPVEGETLTSLRVARGKGKSGFRVRLAGVFRQLGIKPEKSRPLDVTLKENLLIIQLPTPSPVPKKKM